MTDEKFLFQYTVATDQGARSFQRETAACQARTTDAAALQASNWLQANVGGDATWLGERLVIEIRHQFMAQAIVFI